METTLIYLRTQYKYKHSVLNIIRNLYLESKKKYDLLILACQTLLLFFFRKVFRSSQNSADSLASVDTDDRNVKISLMSHPQNEDATKYVVGRRSSPLEVDLEIDSETKKVFSVSLLG